MSDKPKKVVNKKERADKVVQVRKPRPPLPPDDWQSKITPDVVVVEAILAGGRVWGVCLKKVTDVQEQEHISAWCGDWLEVKRMRRFGVFTDLFLENVKAIAHAQQRHTSIAYYATDMWSPDEFGWVAEPDMLIMCIFLGAEDWVARQKEKAYETRSSEIHEMVREDEHEVFARAAKRKRNQKRDQKDLTHYHALDDIRDAQKSLFEAMTRYLRSFITQ